MECPNCGAECGPGDSFCGRCGTTLLRLLPRFEEVQRRLSALRARLQAGEITDPEFHAAVGSLVVEDATGAFWRIEAQSGEWYRHDGEMWVQSSPPVQEVAPPPLQKVPPPPPAPPLPPKAQPRWALKALAILAGGLGPLVVVCLAVYLFFPDRLPFTIPGWRTSTPADVAVVGPGASPTWTPTRSASSMPTASPTLLPTAMPTRTAEPPAAGAVTPTERPAEPPTATSQPPTATSSPTPTLQPPTPTPEPPTPTPEPPTPTPLPPTPTPQPPTPTPVVVSVLDNVPVDNGQWGPGVIWVEFKNGIILNGPDGHRYDARMGFLSSDESIAAIQEYWTRGGRGGGPWKMKLVVRKQVAWVSCPSDRNICWESEVSPPQCLLTVQVHYREHVWLELLNLYLAGGCQAATSTAYYGEIQRSVFEPICNSVPDVPCIGFRFERVS